MHPAMPAEQTRMSRPPSSLSTRATAASSSAERVTSPAMPSAGAELVRSRLYARGIEIEDGDAAAARLDAPGAGRADAARSAGDEGDAPVEVHVCHWQRV